MKPNYKIVILLEDSEEKQIFFEKYKDELLRHTENCYHKTYMIGHFKGPYDIFICMYDETIVGISYTTTQHTLFYTTEHVDTYYSLYYLYLKHIEKDSYIAQSFTSYDFTPDVFTIDVREEDKDIGFAVRKIAPFIKDICKDHKYDGVGEFLLENIEMFYKEEGYKQVTVVINNSSMMKELSDAMDNVDMDKKDTLQYAHTVSLNYKRTQSGLMEYYKKKDIFIRNIMILIVMILNMIQK